MYRYVQVKHKLLQDRHLRGQYRHRHRCAQVQTAVDQTRPSTAKAAIQQLSKQLERQNRLARTNTFRFSTVCCGTEEQTHVEAAQGAVGQTRLEAAQAALEQIRPEAA
jgi:hypothetical protein